MPKSRSIILIAVLAVATSLSAPVMSTASPLPPDVRASRSENGRYLVFIDRKFDRPHSAPSQQSARNTYLVFVAETFINYKDRLDAANSFWSGGSAEGWQVTPEGRDAAGLFWPIISNDGQSLVLVSLGTASVLPNLPVLKIYRKNGYSGKLVRDLRITDLWSPSELRKDGISTETDATPKWFAGGGFSFSPDNQNLIFRTRWNDRVIIRLVDGAISRARM